MSTLSVPLTPQLEIEIDRMVKNGVASNKAAVVRRAIEKLVEDEAVNAVLLAQNEPTLKGDLRKLMKKIR
ncbi:MAG: hypothetical protein A2845_03040 [Candidatus Lloydbacteria bacterium RIFCSPHIGHO2_01_FULL_49_22]|uniref:Ribbon-helix-helix protein CopG domain-containing protein n=1 Tax=Candidatus Lloydbacteria bacterium RIFCSPHIGHO2_01_FULL_49_22 TaxID=1798658 RepID=A0A1G2CVL0_9BACT|nr:MAG: hypothetical protein A2845_03040 [Candidatus Lloydbacteria bacterium RIFCSPHIGHO2_01_FULL_49_22]OGZ10413.1 MAG: hypothetical protein A3C14_02735 [Candidatus Lloydbacteria bacterium RIFCSPHIGHO2_02_FULL_50_18]